MEKKMVCINEPDREDAVGTDIYSIIRSAEIRDYYRRENVCDDWEKKMVLIQHGYISVQRKAVMLRQLSGPETEEENRLTEEMCLIYSQYTDMIYRPSVRTLFVVESGDLWWDGVRGSFEDNMGLDGVYESLDEVIAHMEDLYGDSYWNEREEARARVTVLHVPPDEKVKEVFKFDMFWIDGKWEIKELSVGSDKLREQGISDDAIDLFCHWGGWQHHPLPFENGCRLKFQLPFMDGPVYGTLESELDGNGCWYHFLYFDEVDGVSGGSVDLKNSEKEKGQASDSFKRACFNWGIGRELYTAPFIWIPAGTAAIQSKDGQNREKKYYCYDRFSVGSIEYNSSREISSLVIVNEKGKSVYAMKTRDASGKNEDIKVVENTGKQKKGNQKDNLSLSAEQMTSLQAELNRTGVTMETVQQRYKIRTPEAMNEELYKKVMSALAKTQTAA